SVVHQRSVHLRVLRSFPTRRSSDLGVVFTVDEAAIQFVPAAQTPDGVGDQARLTITVTNNGDTAVDSLVAQSDVGDLTCRSASLGAGKSTTCSMMFTPADGTNTVTVVFADGTDPSTAATYQFTYQKPAGNGGPGGTADVTGVSDVTGGAVTPIGGGSVVTGGGVTPVAGGSVVTGGVSPVTIPSDGTSGIYPVQVQPVSELPSTGDGSSALAGIAAMLILAGVLLRRRAVTN